MKIQKFLIAILFVFGSVYSNAQTSDLKTNITDLNTSELASTDFNDIIKKYEGKVIYLDFWASWCRPCKNEMPHSLKMQEKFKEKDVVFVYISTDKDVKAWKNAINTLNITGEHYRVNQNVHTQMMQKFDVRYIPRYVIIDKKGNVVDATAKRPSNTLVADDLEKLL